MSPSVHSSEERPRSRITSHTSRPQSQPSRNGDKCKFSVLNQFLTWNVWKYFSWIIVSSWKWSNAIAGISWSSRRWNKKVKRTSPYCWVGEFFSEHKTCPAAMGSGASFGRNWNANLWCIVRWIRVKPRKWSWRHGAKSWKYHITLWGQKGQQIFSFSLFTVYDVKK